MMVGCMPLASNRSAAPRRLPAITTTDVVPSPASTSCALLRSTSIFAAGCITLMLFNMVLPSFVIRFSPFPDCIILSIPRGPKDVLIASETARAAMMLADRTAIGFSLSWHGELADLWDFVFSQTNLECSIATGVTLYTESGGHVAYAFTVDE